MWECICCVLNYPCMHVYRIILWHSESYICNDECSIQHTYIYTLYIYYTNANTPPQNLTQPNCPSSSAHARDSYQSPNVSAPMSTASWSPTRRGVSWQDRSGAKPCTARPPPATELDDIYVMYIYIHFYITVCIYILHTCFILKEYNTIEYKKDWFQVL